MSKIGRKPIVLDAVDVTVDGQVVRFKGKNSSGEYVLPDCLHARSIDGELKIECPKKTRKNNMLWGLHRALLANKISGAQKDFQKNIIITGLGYKTVISGDKLVFSLGKSHKIEVSVPKGISVETDKTGQTLRVKGASLNAVGDFCSNIKLLRPPEPYKGTGINIEGETIIRKAGKTKGA